jgi:uncharacterized protein (TIGR03663 family)
MTKLLMKFKEKPLEISLTLIFLLIAALTRFVLLSNKPIHFDESINMWFVERIWNDGFFRYDPTNYHGPMMFYLIQFVQLFTGFDFLSTRWVATIFSFLSLVILWFGPLKQRGALRWASVFLLMSPAMGFYGRSGIHESAFVFFQILGFLSFHYLAERDFKKFWLLFIAGLLGMMALKETFLVLILAFGPAGLFVLYTERKTVSVKKWSADLIKSFKTPEVYFPLLGMFLLFLGFYSGFGSNPKGLADFFIALAPWLKTGVHGAGHEKSFWFWSELIAKNEFAILAGFFLSLFFVMSSKWIRFYLAFTFFLWLIYSLIPYKTPWCIISILWPFAILAGFGVDEFLKKFKGAAKQAPLFAGLVLLMGGEAYRLNQVVYNNPIDMDHPYVYVNSTYPMKEFIEKTQALLVENPVLRAQTIQIGTEESWPIPIVFSKTYTLSYFRTNAKVEEGALMHMVDAQDQKILEETLQKRGVAAQYGGFKLNVRQGRSEILVYVKKEFFSGRFSWELKEVGSL